MVVSAVFMAIDLAVILWYYPKLPDRIPSHFDGNFVPTDYSGKASIFVLWCIHVIIVALINLLVFFFRKRGNSIYVFIVLILLLQMCMAIIDTLRTVFISIDPHDKTNFSMIELIVFVLTLGLGAYGYYRSRMTGKPG